MENAEEDIMEKEPRNPQEGVFANGLGIDLVYQGTVIAILTLISYMIGNAQSHITGMTMAFMTLSMCEIFHSLNMRSRVHSIFRLKASNKYLAGAMAAAFILTLGVIYIPGLNDVFKLTALPAGDFFAALGIAFAIIPVVEIVKLFKSIARKARKSKA
jgi:Ca2+-transporting ATPase